MVPGFAAFALCAAFSVRLVRAALDTTTVGIALSIGLLVLAFVLRRKRFAEWKETPTMFEDDVPGQPLQLGW